MGVVRSEPEIMIRPERPGDREAIATVVAAAFGSHAEADLVDAIRASPEYIPELALVAEMEGGVAGHVMVSYAALHHGGERHRIFSLAPLAVAPAHQGKGVGSALVRAVTARAEESGAPFVVLEGSPEYYGRFGFQPARSFGIEMPLPSWAPPEAAQLLVLRGYDPSVRGQVVYPPAFDLVAEPEEDGPR